MINQLARRTPAIVAFTQAAAIVTQWLDLPTIVPDLLAVVVGGLALVLFGTRGRQQVRHKQNSASDSDTSWIAYELAGKGTPHGFYVLGFFGVLTVVLTGIQSAYAMPAWAALALTIAWGLANARYPADDE